MELQLMDSMNMEEDELLPWDIREVIGHIVAINPRTRGSRMIKDKHLRLKVKSADGEEAWVQADSVRADIPFPAV